MLRTLAVLAVTLAFGWAFSLRTANAQHEDPIIEPGAGEEGSRFQVVGQVGWTPGETITLRIGFTTSDPLAFTGPFAVEEQVTVLRDGTWSFPVTVNDDLLGAPLPATSGFIVVEASSATRKAINAFVFTVNGARPAGADVIAPLGFGPLAPSPAIVSTVALFAAAVGGLLTVAGTMRRMEREGRASVQRPASSYQCWC